MALNLLGSPRSASKVMELPLGDQAESPLVPLESVSFFTPDPSAFIRKTSLTCRPSFGLRSLRPLSKTSVLPSGDHTGQPLSYAPLVSRLAPERSALAPQTCQCPFPSLTM